MGPALLTALALLAHLHGAQPSRPTAKVQFFAVQTLPSTGQSVEVRPGPSPQVMCTMPLLRPPANVDPKIVVEPPKNGAKIRAIIVPPCIEQTTR